jgi:RND family efflux transporter MFP subunit
MARAEWLLRFSWRGTAVLALAVGVGGYLLRGTGGLAAPGVATAEVVRGEFVDLLTLRGEVKALRSVLISAPSGVGDLQIVQLAANGTEVKKGDVVVRFDTTSVERTLAEKRSLLRQAEAEIEKAVAQARLQEEGTRTEQMKGQYDVERAKLDVGTRDVISRIEGEKAVIALSNAEQKVVEVEARLGANRAGSRADVSALEQKRDKARADVEIEERKLAALTLRAPIDGLMTVAQNWRAGGGPFGAREFRAGDRAWPGSTIGELPELASPYVLAKIDEIDRGRLKAGMDATVVVEALPGSNLAARLTAFSTLAKPDYSTWPPPRLFDVTIDLTAPEERLRPGMTGSVRVPVEKIPNVLLVPTRALMQSGGAPHVYVLGSDGFERRPVVVARRGQTQAAITKGVEAGDHVALDDPEAGRK